MSLRVETVSGPNLWKDFEYKGRHRCYFCRPEAYPPMLKGHTLCARCGQLIYVPELDDPMNDAMVVCEKCEQEMGAET